MKKLATALACFALVAFVSPPAFAAPPLESGLEVAPSRLLAAVPPAEPGEDYSSGAMIDDPACYENTLADGPWTQQNGKLVDLDFTIGVHGTDYTSVWVEPTGVLPFNDSLETYGMDTDDADLFWSREVIAPLLGGMSPIGWWGDYGNHLSTVYYGLTQYVDLADPEGRYHQALCVTWRDVVPSVPVGPARWVVNEWDPAGGYWAQDFEWDSSRRNSFQVLLVDRSDTGAGNFDIVYNYDSVEWQVESTAIDYYTGAPIPSYLQAGWSMGIGVSPCDSVFCWRGNVEGFVADDGSFLDLPQVPYPNDYWFPQHDADGNRETYLNSSPTGLAVTSTNSHQVGRHVFPIRYTEGPRWHLALVLDGSASVTPEEYAAEIDAIVAGLDDEEAFPRDGRFGISVTVVGGYADPSTGTAVDAEMFRPETPISSDAAMESLQTWIRAIPQSTSEGGSDAVGLAVAVNDSASFLSRDALRSVCQISFSRPSTELRGDLPGYRASNAVDRVDLIGIGGNSGGNTGSSVEEHGVENLLFGGNQYRYVPSTADLAEEWVGHCAQRFPLIRGIEVNQAVQNLENEVPLVEGRSTIVRVYVEKTFADDPNPYLIGSLTARHARPPFTTLAGWEDPIRIAAIDPVVDALDPGNRADGTKVLEYRLPSSWTTGDVVLTLETDQALYGGAGLGVTCTWGTAFPLGPCEIRTTYTASPPLALDLYIIDIGGRAPTDEEVREQLWRLQAQFPIASKDGIDLEAWTAEYEFSSPTILGVPSFVMVLLSLKSKRESAQARSSGAKPYAFGLTNPQDYQLRGMGYAGAAVSDIGRVRGEEDAHGFGPWRNAMVHELGHAMGLDHALGAPASSSRFPKDLCGAVSAPFMSNLGWTHDAVFDDVDEAGAPSLVQLPTISDFDPSAGLAERQIKVGAKYQYQPGTSRTATTVWDEYWGVDTSYVGSDFPTLAYSDPRRTGELMSYVNNWGVDSKCEIDGSARGQGYWVSPETYAFVREHLAPLPGTRTEAPASEVIMYLIESVNWGNVVINAVEIGPLIGVPFLNTGRSNPLGYVLNLYDGTGRLLDVVTPDVDFAAGESGEEDGTLYGILVADFPRQDVARMDLVQNGVVIASNAATPATPVVDITSPTEGASVDSDVVDLAWIASDADGDALTFDVQYSPDGLDWDTLEMGLTGDGVAIDRSRIAGSDAGQFLVVVNDGFNSSSDTVDGLAVAGNPPWLLVDTPKDGEHYSGSVPISFDAWTSDREDRSLPSSQVVWESSLDGIIDTTQDVRASDLTVGVHVITATATDSDGNTATDSVTITILPDESSEPGATGSHHSGTGATPEPEPSLSLEPQPSPSSGVDETPSAEPSPSPSPSLMATESSDSGSGAWLWGIGLAFLVAIAAAVGGLWNRQRTSREM